MCVRLTRSLFARVSARRGAACRSAVNLLRGVEPVECARVAAEAGCLSSTSCVGSNICEEPLCPSLLSCMAHGSCGAVERCAASSIGRSVRSSHTSERARARSLAHTPFLWGHASYVCLTVHASACSWVCLHVHACRMLHFTCISCVCSGRCLRRVSMCRCACVLSVHVHTRARARMHSPTFTYTQVTDPMPKALSDAPVAMNTSIYMDVDVDSTERRSGNKVCASLDLSCQWLCLRLPVCVGVFVCQAVPS